jgi:hypothetical protein
MNFYFRLLAYAFYAALFALVARAAQLAPGEIVAATVKGDDVTFMAPGTAQFVTLKAGTTLPQGVVIKTGTDSVVGVVLSSGSVVGIEPNSEIEFTKFEQEFFTGLVKDGGEPSVSKTEIRVASGAIVSKVNKLKTGSSYTVDTPQGTAAVRGTTFRISVSNNGITTTTDFQLLEGAVIITQKVGNEPPTTLNLNTRALKMEQKNGDTKISFALSNVADYVLLPELANMALNLYGAGANNSLKFINGKFIIRTTSQPIDPVIVSRN